MVPVIPLVHLDPSWTAISGVWLHEVVQAGSRWSRGGPGAPAGPWCWVVDQERSGPPWSTKKLFPDDNPLPRGLNNVPWKTYPAVMWLEVTEPTLDNLHHAAIDRHLIRGVGYRHLVGA